MNRFRCLMPLWEIAPRFGSSSTPSTSSTSSSSAPWPGQQPYLTGSGTPGQAGSIQGVFPAAANLYNNSSDWPQYYPQSTYSPLTAGQQGFLSGISGYAGNLGNTGINAANSSLTSTLAPGYTNQTGSAFSAANPQIASLAGGSAQQQAQPAYDQSQQYLSNMIGGGTTNPFTSPGFQNVVNGTLASVLPATSASFINGGRSDSGLAQAAQTSAATNAIGQLANQNYTQEQGLQAQAAAQAASNYGQGLNATLGAGTLASNNLLTQQGNQIKGAAVAPSVDAGQLSDLNAGLSATGVEQTNNQNMLNDLVARYNYGQTLPFNMLGQYQNYVGGTGYGASTTGQSTTPYYSNTAANIAAGVGGAAALGNVASQAAGYSNLGQGLSALYSLSDRRLKTDIEKVGMSDSGFPMFSFRYKWDEPGTKHVGLMAQDVIKTRPDAIAHTPFGMAVDYSKALAT